MDLEAIKKKLEKIMPNIQREVTELLGEAFNYDFAVEVTLPVGGAVTSEYTDGVLFPIGGAVKVKEHKAKPVEEKELSECCSVPITIGPAGDALWTMCSKCLKLITELNPR